MKTVGFAKIMKNKKALKELFALGKQYDAETDPVKKEALKQDIEARCALLKGKLAVPGVQTPAPNAVDSLSEKV